MGKLALLAEEENVLGIFLVGPSFPLKNPGKTTDMAAELLLLSARQSVVIRL
jgi:hypothetical protein